MSGPGHGRDPRSDPRRDPRRDPDRPDRPDRPDPHGAGAEHGGRERFLDEARLRLAGGIPVNAVHPPRPGVRSPAGGGRTAVPEPVYANLDRDDLLGTFVRSVVRAGALCHHVVGEVPALLVDELVAEADGGEVVVSGEPEALALGRMLAARDVPVAPAERATAARARMGVTSAVAGIAVTGSVVLDSARAGGRLASVLPPLHVCLLPVARLVATPAEVLRPLGEDPTALPSSLVVVTGPSRTGDIEQILTIGAHGPTALRVIVTSPA